MKALLLAGGLLLLAGPAYADSADDAAAVLRSTPVYQAAGLDVVDVPALTSELQGADPRVDVAVLPSSAAGSDDAARSRAIDIGRTLGESDLVVVVLTADHHIGVGQGSAAAHRGVNARAALAAERGSLSWSKDGLTAFIGSFKERIVNQAARVSSGGGSSSSSSGHSGLWLLGGLAVIGAGGAALVVRSSRRRTARLNEGLRAEVEQLYERLGADVLNLDPKDNEQAKQALADASERYSACGSQLAAADAPAEFAAARRTAVEGLTAARTARVALGMDPGPEVPLVPGDGPQLATEEKVSIGGQTYDGAPQYAPGRQHYFGGGTIGGQQVPGGWYSGNFWDTFLLGSILTGGFGGGGGFDRGYDEGYQAGQDQGGDWGGGGSGGGGGDWGGGGDSGGGGDW